MGGVSAGERRACRCAARGAGSRSSAPDMPGSPTALELSRHGVEAVVLEKGALGIGASTRNGGSVSGGVNVGKSFTGRAADVDPERANRLLSDASDAFSLIERLIDEERIDCFWQKRGRFVGAWTPRHYAAQEKRLGKPQRRGAVGRLYGAARAPARGNRQRLLSRRDGRRTLGEPASGALLQGPARCLPAPRRSRSAPRRRSRRSRATAPAGGSRPAAAR